MKKAIVIGATSGIGRSLAQQLVKEGYQVGITGRRIELLGKLQAESPSHYFVRSFDISETAAVPSHLEALANELGGIDLLILSSGTGDLNDALDFEIEKRTIDTNVSGFTAVVDWSFNYFEKQKVGHLVAITSLAGLRGGSGAPAYNATKAYQINYLEAMRQKAAKIKLPIIVTDIRAGFVNTAMAKGEGQFWVAPVDKAARQIVVAIKRKKNVAYVTRRWGVVAFLLKRLPNFIYNRL